MEVVRGGSKIRGPEGGLEPHCVAFQYKSHAKIFSPCAEGPDHLTLLCLDARGWIMTQNEIRDLVDLWVWAVWVRVRI